MDISKAFPGQYIKAADLDGPKIVTITNVTMEAVGDDSKPVLRWKGSEQGLVLNKTNSMFIAEALGPETSDWTGKEIELYATKTQFGSKIVDCIRTRAPGTEEPDNGQPF
jgi:hypothetical protein